MLQVGISQNLILRLYPFFLSEINPLDYVYKSLECRLELLNPDSDECQLILEYIHNSRK